MASGGLQGVGYGVMEGWVAIAKHRVRYDHKLQKMKPKRYETGFTRFPEANG